MDLSSIFSGIEIKSKMLDIPYGHEEKMHVLEKLDNLQSKIENCLTNSTIDIEKDLKKIDDIINLIKERDVSLSPEIKAALNNIYNFYK